MQRHRWDDIAGSRPFWSRPASRCHISPLSSAASRRGVVKVLAAQKGSPWSTGPDASRGKSNKKSSSSSSKKSTSKGSKSSNKPGKSSSKVPSGQGFGPSKAPTPQAPLYKLTPPLTPQLLDELSSWEMSPAPLWGTFTGHCEGEWLGQYGAYTPWGGDPEPVWADESGTYLLYAYSRASEARQQMPVGAFTAADAAAIAAEAGEEAAAEEDQELVDMLVRTTTRSASISSLIGGMSASKASAAAAAEQAAAAAGATVSSSAAAAAAAAVAGDSAAAAVAAEDDETEGFAYNRDGSVVFNGGSYSVGPELIGAPELDDDLVAAYEAALNSSNSSSSSGGDGGGGEADEAAADLLASLPYSTVVIEQALVAGGDARLRLVATLKLRQPPGEQELDVEVARLLLYKEHWYGTAESTSGTFRRSQTAAGDSSSSSSGSSGSSGSRFLQLVPAHKFDVPVISMARPQPSQLAGSWNVFVVAANPITEENPDTLQEEEVLVYSSREERQQWHVPGITSSAALGSSIPAGSSIGSSKETGDETAAAAGAAAAAAAATEELDDDGSGGSFWLPAGAVATFRMVPLSSNGSSSNAEYEDGYSGNGNGVSSSSNSAVGRGLLVAFHWLVDDGSCLLVERQYDAEGQLAETRQGTAVKGGWSGGRM